MHIIFLKINRNDYDMILIIMRDNDNNININNYSYRGGNHISYWVFWCAFCF